MTSVHSEFEGKNKHVFPGLGSDSSGGRCGDSAVAVQVHVDRQHAASRHPRLRRGSKLAALRQLSR